MWPRPTAKRAIKTKNIEFNKNILYEPLLINSYKLADHPLNVVRDPQNPNPRINLYLFKIFNEFKKPNKKQPIQFTRKISSVCHRSKAPGNAPIEIQKKVFFLKNVSI